MAKAKASKVPGHYTEKGTRKFQSNGPVEWSKSFKAAAKAAGEEREGKGIMLAMYYAIANEKAFLAFAAKEGAAAIDGMASPVKAKPAKAPKAKPAKGKA
jgi:hypothetical protein